MQTLKLDQRLGAAAVVFPTTAFAEKDGSFVNHAGRVQRIYKAIETAPGWLSDGEIFTRLLNAIDPGDRRFDPDAMWERYAARIRASPGFRWTPSEPVARCLTARACRTQATVEALAVRRSIDALCACEPASDAGNEPQRGEE